MLRLAAQMLRFRKGSFVATFVALAAGVAILTTCALLAESGWRYKGEPQHYGAALAVVADRDLRVAGPTVLGETEYTTVALPERGSVPEALAGELASVPGVARAVGDRSIAVTATAAPDVPATGHGWSSAALAPYRLADGRAPRSEGEIALDARLARRGGLAPGDTTDIVTGGVRRSYRVSGVVATDGAPGERAALFFTDARAAALDPHPGRFDAVGVLAEPDADRTAVLAEVRRIAQDADAKAYTGDERGLAGQPDAAAARALTLQAGGAFGGYAAMIMIFAVAGTVGLSVRHRRRDLALLRAVAATPGQVRLMLVAEVGLLGLCAAVAGVPAGLAATGYIRDELVDRGFVPGGFTVQGGPLSAAAATVAVAVVALLAAWIAALRITRIRPTEALGEAAVERPPGSRARVVSGLACLAAGVSLTGLTGATDGQTALGAATGMLYAFVLGVALLAPWINQAAARLLGPVLRTVWGNSGHLAAANLRANARGTVAVLTALVLSVGLGGTVWFLQDNLERQTVVQSRDGILAQHALTGGAGLPASATAEARRIPGVLAATGVRRTSVVVPNRLEAQTVVAQGIDPKGVERTLDLDVTSGSLDRLAEGTMAVSTAQADASGWRLGDEADLWLGDGTPVTLRVVALYERGWGFGDVTLHTRTLTGHTVTGLDDQVLIRTAPDADVAAALAGLARAYPAAAVVDTDRLTGELAEDLAVSGWLNRMLIAVLVGYAVLAAANTLVMAALARTRELSLLRLVGVTRGQVKRMVHAEQAGLLGVALVIGAAIAAVTLTTIVNAVTGTRVPYVPAAGSAAVLGGTIVLAVVATVLPIGRVLRTPPVEGIGIRE
ncbi:MULTISPECIES: FtsX-like permease family protein [unclassified Streptomyces]|uniref:FtsX-like permease family protein n=1 Tax=unclassified Streptomyces TaxID=2593676 RepID=UPI000F6E4AAE|nr:MULTISPECIES: ABC transporter permease [unclassified Streptomyces]AZM64079.1 ABC transporter permease [Streptomyces sp. WAC 01438]RSM88169.1 ABC transporter permease [Streptomyces sp. WAC 01420]